jgi:hypothetical protein
MLRFSEDSCESSTRFATEDTANDVAAENLVMNPTSCEVIERRRVRELFNYAWMRIRSRICVRVDLFSTSLPRWRMAYAHGCPTDSARCSFARGSFNSPPIIPKRDL